MRIFARSLTLPARFGNFIGEEPEASDEGSERGVGAGYEYEDDEVDEAPDAIGHELMELDGMSTLAQSESRFGSMLVARNL